MTLEQKLEAILFYRGEPVSFVDLTKLLSVGLNEVTDAVVRLKELLDGHGISVLISDDKVALVTAPTMSGLIEDLRKEEYSGDITKAASETLAIVLYQGPLSRFEIDYVRGVNSTFTLRNLQVRGLIEKIPNPSDKRGFLYRATPELLAHLGLTGVSELPEFDKVKRELEAFKIASETQDKMST